MYGAHTLYLRAKSYHVSLPTIAANAIVLFVLIVSILLSFVAYTSVALRSANAPAAWTAQTCKPSTSQQRVQGAIRSAACRLATRQLGDFVQTAGAFLPALTR